MRIIAKRTLRDFWVRYPDAERPLMAWFNAASAAAWASSAELKAAYRNASIITNERVVFNIAGNKYRLVVSVWYAGQTIWVKFVGTHREYDKIDPETV